MPDEIDHIAQLQQKLYARDPDSTPKRRFGILRPLRSKTESKWGEVQIPQSQNKFKKTSSGYKKFFIFSLIFFVIALGITLFSIYRGAITLSSKNVEVSILGNSFVSGGEALPIQIDITNKNSASLVNAELTLSYPKGSFVSEQEDVTRIKKNLGDIASGKTKTESFSVVLYGEQGTSRNITATLEYSLAGSNAVFVKEKSFSVIINSSPIALTIDAPSSVSSNQPFVLKIRTFFTGDSPILDTILKVEYPSGFVPISTNPQFDIGTSSWNLGEMKKGDENLITIKGKLIGDEQDEKSFRIYIGSKTSEADPKIAFSYNSILHTIKIEEPFLSGNISIAGNTDDVIALPYGSSVSGNVSYVNNFQGTVSNVQVALLIDNPDVDADSVVANGGFYNLLEKTIYWNPETALSFNSLSAGSNGVLPFSFSLKDSRSTKDINLNLSVRGGIPDRDLAEVNISSIDQKIIRFASKLQFASNALYSIGPIKNTGPFPPRVDKETSYTISWTFRPVENALEGATAFATLPLGVSWSGSVFPASEAISYNPETRMVSWNIGSVPRFMGTSAVRNVYFQVKVTPNKNQLGEEIILVDETQIKATDSVAKSVITTSKMPLNNKLTTDPAYSVGKEKVLP